MGYSSNSNISDSSSAATVSGSYDYVGGLVGLNYDSDISNSHFTGGNVTGGNYTGGLVGYMYSTTVGGSSATAMVTSRRRLRSVSAATQWIVPSCASIVMPIGISNRENASAAVGSAVTEGVN